MLASAVAAKCRTVFAAIANAWSATANTTPPCVMRLPFTCCGATVSVTVQLVSPTGAVLGTQSRTLGPLSRDQLNVASDFGYSNLSDAVFVISSPTSGAAVGAYASVIDAATQDPRTLLPR